MGEVGVDRPDDDWHYDRILLYQVRAWMDINHGIRDWCGFLSAFISFGIHMRGNVFIGREGKILVGFGLISQR